MTQKISVKWEEGEFGLRSAGIMLDNKNRVLLCRLEEEFIWVIPGGGSVLHETSKETVEREFLEEVGFEVDVQRLLWIEENFFEYGGAKIHGLGFYFLVTPKDANGIWEQEEFAGQEDEFRPGEKLKMEEGCLCLPKVSVEIERLSKAQVKGLDINGKEILIEAGDLLGRALQHETDHLNGILIIDHLFFFFFNSSF